MASIALRLRSRPRPFLPQFSSASSSSPPENVIPAKSDSNSNPNPNPDPKTSFTDLKSHLRSPSHSHSHSHSHSSNNHTMPIDEIRNRLRDFNNRSASQPISFQELYKKSVSGTSSASTASSPSNILSSIRERLRNKSPESDPARSSNKTPGSLFKLKESLRARPGAQVLGGATEGVLPVSIFGKEMRHSDTDSAGSALAKNYTFEELGKKLRELRPDGGVKGFSVSDLNERLVKLRQIEDEVGSKGNGMYDELRGNLRNLQISEFRKTQAVQRVNILNHLSGTPSYMSTPPKEHLVEKYFHPDNMSSADKLKIELKRVRDEFKMSETDCGSTRVQIAQLTTEIIHLSKVLHKKDKHSLKGLLAKVQLRKKLLKYLRRTDWDSYCFILSKFELRDNPGYKLLPSKKHPPKKVSSKKKPSKKLTSKMTS